MVDFMVVVGGEIKIRTLVSRVVLFRRADGISCGVEFLEVIEAARRKLRRARLLFESTSSDRFPMVHHQADDA